MKNLSLIILLIASLFLTTSCRNNNSEAPPAQNPSAKQAGIAGGQSTVSDDVSQQNVVKVAINSNDHSTLVKAVQAADLVNALSNNGPFTVFAPTNQAFDAMPAGTLEGLLKPEKKDDLADISSTTFMSEC
jgi:uncharacterized surface protein with fasciclin (FAS1) repeats